MAAKTKSPVSKSKKARSTKVKTEPKPKQVRPKARKGKPLPPIAVANEKAAVKEPELKTVPIDYEALQVFRDQNGVVYLRVSIEPNSAKFVVHKGFSVELVEIDYKSVKSLYLQPVVDASILEAAKRLLHPLNDQVTISQRAKEHLTTFVNDKEIQTMATKPTAKAIKKFSTVNAPAAKGSKEAKAAKSAAKKPAGEPRKNAASEKEVKYKKAPKDGDLPKQAEQIVEILKAKGSMTVAELQKAMEGKVQTKQPMSAIWGFYRARLIAGGFITVAE